MLNNWWMSWTMQSVSHLFCKAVPKFSLEIKFEDHLIEFLNRILSKFERSIFIQHSKCCMKLLNQSGCIQLWFRIWHFLLYHYCKYHFIYIANHLNAGKLIIGPITKLLFRCYLKKTEINPTKIVSKNVEHSKKNLHNVVPSLILRGL